MTVRCERCDEVLQDGGSGLLAKVGLGADRDGYECQDCGLALCETCHRERKRELAGASPRNCPQCSGYISHR